MNINPKNLQSVQIEIVPDGAQFDEQIEALSDACFGPGRFAKAASLLRENNTCHYELSRVAFAGAQENDRPIGGCRIWPIKDRDSNLAYFLGPIVVDENFRGLGIGAKLIDAVVGACNAKNNLPIILVGDLPFFGRFGFETIPNGLLSLPAPINPTRFLWKTSASANLCGRLFPL